MKRWILFALVGVTVFLTACTGANTKTHNPIDGFIVLQDEDDTYLVNSKNQVSR